MTPSTAPRLPHLRLTKHEGLGNDFLVLLDPERSIPISTELVQQVCDRHRGVGADGLMRASTPRGDGAEGTSAAAAVMELYNADGSRAEMSGNGIRCLAQALLVADWTSGPDIPIWTDAGLRHVSLIEPAGEPSGEQWFSVGMGSIAIGDDAPQWAQMTNLRARWASAGNPHLVCELDHASAVAAFDLEELGEKVAADVPEGANVHVVAPGEGDGTIIMRTYERGVGLTQACGTGACAVTAVGASWGLPGIAPGEAVAVTMPGGTAQVVLGDESAAPGGRPATLTGPASYVAAIEFRWP